MKVLGVSAFYHDAAAALVVDGEIVAAAQEERFSRRRHDPRFPADAVRYCLDVAQTVPGDIDFVAFYDKPLLKFERMLETYLAFAPRGFLSFREGFPVWIKDKLFQKYRVLDGLVEAAREEGPWEGKLLFSEHHLSHAASAFYPSPFERAAVLTMDGVGEWTTTSLAVGEANALRVLKEIHFPHSIGLLYSAFTYHAGFKVNSGEYKLMGLAPYGRPVYAAAIRDHLIDLKEDGSFRLNMDYFDFCTGLTMTNACFERLFGGPPRSPDAPLTQREMDLAASVQNVTEDIVLRLAVSARRETAERKLCLAGGVALNCVANGKLARAKIFDEIWVQPAAGDAGGALGAALVAYFLHARSDRRVSDADGMHGSLLGPEFANEQITARLDAIGAVYDVVSDQELLQRCAGALARGRTLGWHQGRMEFGPRALGARSILGDPRSPAMQRELNLKIKFRESFRPFAPAVLRERAGDWFDLDGESPYMSLVADVAESRRLAITDEQRARVGLDALYVPRSTIPAVTHVDGSARVQTVDRHTNPRFHALLEQFHALTGCPVLVNTSFNVRGEPIVCTPEDSFTCFMSTDLDMLAIGNAICEKTMQRVDAATFAGRRFAPD